MNEEILSGLKIAAERGFAPERSAQSFINAGYNPSEVREAATFLAKGFTPLPKTANGPAISAAPATSAATPVVMTAEQPKKESSRTKWIIIILIALVLLGIIIPMLLFKDQFLNVIDSIAP